MGTQLQGARVLLTGASGGIGAAIATALHARGATVLASARRADVLDALAARLGDRVEPLPADLADRDDVARLAERAGRVDVLVANAALPGSGAYLGFSAGEVDRTLEVNLRAPMQLALALAPAMVERRTGALVFISSLAGKVATPGSALYAGTKFGLRGFSFGLREDLLPTGVTVSAVFPGFIRDAGMFHEAGVELPRFVGTRTPDDVAAAVLRAVDSGKAEIDVAPLSLRLGGWIAGAAPSALAALQRRLGAQRISEKLGEGQRSKYDP